MHVCMKVGKGYKHAWLLFWGEFLLLSAINTELVFCTFLPQTLSLSMFAGEATPPLGASTGRLACLCTGTFDSTHPLHLHCLTLRLQIPCNFVTRLHMCVCTQVFTPDLALIAGSLAAPASCSNLDGSVDDRRPGCRRERERAQSFLTRRLASSWPVSHLTSLLCD